MEFEIKCFTADLLSSTNHGNAYIHENNFRYRRLMTTNIIQCL
jgi:hypothetical protein